MSIAHSVRSAVSTNLIVPMVAITIAGFIVLVFFILYSYSHYMNGLDDVLLEGEIESQKMHIISEIMEVARSRTRRTSQIIDTDDPFEQDELNMELERYAGRFVLLRQKLMSLPLTDEERDILVSNDKIVPIILPAQRAAVEMAMNEIPDDDKEAQQLLYEVVLPGQGKLIESFSQLIALEQQRIAELTQQSRSSLRVMRQRSNLIVSVVLSIAIVLSFIVMARIRKIQQDLRISHAQLERVNIDLETKVKERTRELSELNQKLRDASEHDELTNLYNRRKFNAFIKNEYARTNRTATCFALIFIDIDYFKQYNDHYGHQLGDQCLASVALAMSMSLPRAIDFIARYGGEEFVVILPSTDIEGARKVAENLRAVVSDLKIPHEKSEVEKHITISLGMTIYHAQDNFAISDIIKNADQCLYAAKSKGRNQIVSMS